MFYDNFEKACASKGEKPNPVAMKCGGTKSSASSWKKGSSPNSDIVIKLAEYLNVSTDYLLLGKEPTIPTEYKKLISSYKKLSPENQKIALSILNAMYDVQIENEIRSQIKVTSIRLMINKVSAGIGYDLNFNSDDEFKNIEVLDTPEAEAADYAVTIEGESMSPDFHDGDIVLVKHQDSIDNGQIGIFTIDGDGYIKEYGEHCLISHNPKYPNIYPKEYQNVKCCGLVIGKAELV